MPKDKKQLKEGLPSMLKNFTDDFFDGLKYGAINKALEKAKKHKDIPPPVVQKMIDLEKDAKELKDFLKKYT